MILSPEEKRERGRIACRKWRLKNLERERQRDRDRFHNNKEYEYERSQRWFRNNPERTKKMRREAYHTYKNTDMPSNRKTYRIYSAAKKRAKDRNLEFTIDVSDIIIPDMCPALNIPIVCHEIVDGNNRAMPNSPSLDRIDSSKGYTKDNIAVISWRANAIKHNGTAEEHRLIADYMDRNIPRALET